MNGVKKCLCILLALLISVSLFALPVSAANGERYSVGTVSTHNKAVTDKITSIQSKYFITVSYPTYDVGGESAIGIFPETIETLDTALSYLTPSLVREVSEHYMSKTGKRLRFTYRFSNMSESDEVVVGRFEVDDGLIILYIPHPGQGATITGDAPLTIIHEFGHAVKEMIMASYGEEKLKNEWTALNGSESYTNGILDKNPNEKVFISAYGATDFYEDFAEVFAHGFVCNRAGMGMSERFGTAEAPTALRKKFNKVLNLLKTYFPEMTTAHSNFQKIYTVSTKLSYQSIGIHGSYLQFAGYSEPRYLPLGALDLFSGIPESSYKWVSDIGAWVATDTDGTTILMFPGGTWSRTSKTIT